NSDIFQEPTNYVVHSLAAGYQLYLSPNVRLQPGMLMNYDRMKEASVYGNIKVRYKELVWAGVSYRNREAFGLLAGFLLNDHLSLGYAYEQNVYAFDPAYNGNHEVVVGCRFFRKGYPVNGYFW
ncbi:MAG: type IX secretion system membrane protein PorP/SprF, partial [Bacteroidetes bacterium]|nr:type IX secretion system membrane protein PorP/SprF [Bacteroidota bacterium]